MTIDEILSTMDPGLERSVLNILKKHEGRENAIKKGEFIALLRNMGIRVGNERQLRKTISNLRKLGALIGSTNSDGYFRIRNRQEWNYVKETELQARIRDIAETVSIMDDQARIEFGDGYQLGLLGDTADLKQARGRFL